MKILQKLLIIVLIDFIRRNEYLLSSKRVSQLGVVWQTILHGKVQIYHNKKH